jgi:DNA-binding IclR family transcriptional regulator
VTGGQRAVLTALTDGPLTSREAVERLGYPETYDGVHSCLRRLEDRGMVRRLPRTDGVTVWELTLAGRSALNLTAEAQVDGA